MINQRHARVWWDSESVNDARYATQAWGGDGTPEQVQPTIDKIIVNLDGVLFASNAQLIAELGCGPGRLLHRLAERRPDRTFWGFDISPEMLNLGAANRPTNVRVEVVNGYGFTFAQPVDMVYTVEVFQHLDADTKQAYLRSIAKAIPEGIAVIQYVEGDPGESSTMNYPEWSENMLIWCKEAGLRPRHEYHLNSVHDNWNWLVLSR